MISFREVTFGSEEYQSLLRIRDEVLRKPIGMELREKDIAEDHKEFHFAAFDTDKAIECVLLKPIDNKLIRLRQMAVVDGYKGQGIGAKLVAFAEKMAAAKGYKIIDTKARKTAQGFYEKLGYELSGNDFLEISIHCVMMKKNLD